MKKIISSALIRKELVARGYKATVLDLGPKFTRYVSPTGGVWISHNGYVSYPFVSGSSKVISRNKLMSGKLVEQMGVSTMPTLLHTSDMDAAHKFLHKNSPIVIKPLNSQGAQGISLDVSDEAGLVQGIQSAQAHSEGVLLQRQFIGEEIRITVSRGEVLVAINRRTPRVAGDGISTIEELICKENIDRAALDFHYIEYPQFTGEIIPEQLLHDKRIPQKFEIVELSREILASRGGTFHNVTRELHDDYKKIAVSLADMLNPEFLAIDLLVKDYTLPANDNSYTFLEFTTSPALYVYYGIRDGKQYDIVSKLADMIDEYYGNSAGKKHSPLPE